MKLATWNINSLKVRVDQLLGWLQQNPIDIVCLQETKLVDDKFPVEPLRAAGYEAIYSGQPTYNGVAILYRRDLGLTPEDVIVDNPLLADHQKRLLSARFGSLRVICAYFPNGQSVGSEKYEYKLRWMAALREWLTQLDAAAPAAERVLLGDFNVAPADEDVHDPAAWHGQVMASEGERAAYRELVALGMHDAFRLFDQPPRTFSWWDYRQLGFQRNVGLRIDIVLVSDALRPRVRACWIERGIRKLKPPSDHAPVVVDLADIQVGARMPEGAGQPAPDSVANVDGGTLQGI
ncbi:MAG TPA: exodeoxyribonuclease III [Lautropia sp.]|nr:exodeoxyribonuclease III [Lautropia sp.]